MAEEHSECKEGRKRKSNLPPGITIFDLDGRTSVDAFGVRVLAMVGYVAAMSKICGEEAARKHIHVQCIAPDSRPCSGLYDPSVRTISMIYRHI